MQPGRLILARPHGAESALLATRRWRGPHAGHTSPLVRGTLWGLSRDTLAESTPERAAGAGPNLDDEAGKMGN